MTWIQALTFLIIYVLSMMAVYRMFDQKYKMDIADLMEEQDIMNKFSLDMNDDVIKLTKRMREYQAALTTAPVPGESNTCPVCNEKNIEEMFVTSIDGHKHQNYFCITCATMIAVPIN